MFNFSLFPYSDFNKINLDWVTEILANLAGGTTGEILKKKSDDDYDFEWADESGGGSGSVDSVNGKTGTVVLTASDVGAYAMPSGGIPSTDMSSAVQTALAKAVASIPGPSNPATGAFLVWDGNAWVAQTLSVWQGGNY
jgi:hypothetical protein